MSMSRWMTWMAGLAIVTSLPTGLRADEPALGDLERQFRDLPMEARRFTGPLFWLHGDESPGQLQAEVDRVAEGGNGTFTAESRPHRDWLGEGWYRDLGICLDAAKRNNLTMWIFDEKWWPSQEAGGIVPPKYGSKRLAAREIPFEGPGRVKTDQCGGPNFLAVVAGKTTADGIDPGSLVDLTPFVHDGALTVELAAGQWKLLIFAWEHPSEPRVLVDGASQDCVDWFLQTVYQPHYDRFKADFGKTIVGYFYDEPETHGDWGTEVPKVLAEMGIDWKKAYTAWKFRLAGEAQAAYRYAYHEALSEAWGRTLYGGTARWCRDHGVTSIGHFLEHEHEYLDMDKCAGNMMQLQKHSDMGAIDAVFKQFVPGRKDDSTYQTPKLGSSISHAYGKADDRTMVEIFGARGQDLSYPEMKWWTDLMQVAGVNFFIPHSFNPRAPYDTDCPPYFYNGGYEPRWPLYRVFADYTSRLSVMLSGGRHACPVALLFLGHSRQVGKSVTPENMTSALQDALYDCDWLPYEVFEDNARLVGKEIQLRRERYKVLIVPPVEVIPLATLAKAREFFDQGGVVIGYGFLPSLSATPGHTGAEIAAARSAIWGDAPRLGLTAVKTNAAGGRSYLLPEAPTADQVSKVLAGDASIRPDLEVLEGETSGWLHVLHRAKFGRDIYFVTNQNLEGKARRYRLRINALGVPECWDAMRNEITTIPFDRKGEHVELTLDLEPLESVLLVFQPDGRPLPPRRGTTADPAARTIQITHEQTPTAPAAPSPPAMIPDSVRSLDGCSWVWSQEGNAAVSAAPGKLFFRKEVVLPADRAVKQARLFLSADNEFFAFVNGVKCGQSGGGAGDQSRPAEFEVAPALKQASNALAIVAVNGGAAPNPAGLIGRLRVEFDRGEPLLLAIDRSWKQSGAEQPGWKEPGFDDRSWKNAKEIAPLGGGPWGPMTGSGPTLSPVKASPFTGRVEIPGDIDLGQQRVFLDMDRIAPEEAARVTVNGRDAGGFIGRPLRLDVTRLVKPGSNSVRIEPFAPALAQLVVEERHSVSQAVTTVTEPANPKTNPQARAILNYLESLPRRSDKRLVSGQFAGFGSGSSLRACEDASKKTGHWPAIIGLDYAEFRTGGLETRHVDRIAIDYARQGGIVTISAHLYNPANPKGGGLRDKGVDMETLLKPGHETHARWMKELDQIADGLKELQDAGVVVLWRPFHEMNGDWFWWGGQPPETFIRVWRHMFDHFTQERGLNNLLWTYGPNHGKKTADYYAGDAFVDIVGLDAYTDFVDPRHILGYAEVARLPKPFGFTEFGPHGPHNPPGDYDYLRLRDGIEANFPRAGFFLSWDSKWGLGRNVHTKELLDHPWLVNRDDLPRGFSPGR